MCDHINKKPYEYGYMSEAMVEGLHRKELWYGGPIRTDEMPAYFCSECLEDIN